MTRAILAGLLCVSLAAGAEAAPALKRPAFFLEPGNDAALLAGIDRHMVDKIGFNRRFSLAFVPCGTACGSYWFVDRRTGGVVQAPAAADQGSDIWDVEAKPDTDVIRVVFGPRDGGVGVRCSARHFRWSGKKFVPLGQPAVIACPE